MYQSIPHQRARHTHVQYQLPLRTGHTQYNTRQPPLRPARPHGLHANHMLQSPHTDNMDRTAGSVGRMAEVETAVQYECHGGLLIDSSRTRFFIYAINLHRKRSRPLGPPPKAWLSAQARRRMGQCLYWSYVTVEAVSARRLKGSSSTFQQPPSPQRWW
jgi:hypothetical protein